ncbi:MAG TPA: aldehyde dehydrogenase family protein [Streptosporangiaceae bacterium]|nr:aldehyde dehydrogenase family protein [Streptosporangiaceae bacterium]
MTSTASASPDTVVDPSSLLTDGAQLIGGQWVPAAGGETIDVINPATGEVLLRVPRSGPADIDAAVRAAFEAFPGWRDTSPVARADLLRRWAALCREHVRDIEILEQMEVGHPRWGPSPVPSVIEFPAGLADKITGQTLPTATPDVLGMTIREPFGVCGSIIPWNVPGPIMVTDVAPAIAVGNTIVVKPAEDAPLTCLLLAKLALEAGIPPGVVNVVTGYGTEAGAALPLHPLVRRMSFTGSPETGSAIMAACARNLIPLHVELGGKAPQIVLPDADLSRAVPVIVGSITLNTGQVCAAGSRVLVPSSMRSSLVEELAARFASVRVGPWYEDVQMGPLISARQERRVLGYLDIGRAEGAELVTGGHKLAGATYDQGFFVEPTIFDRVTPDMRIAQEEIFGPVLSVLSYASEDEAVQIANGTKYGLNACVWTSDVSRAVRLARRIQAGQVTINGFGSRGVIGAPWGGYKHSGFGRTMSAESVLDYTQIKTVVINA